MHNVTAVQEAGPLSTARQAKNTHPKDRRLGLYILPNGKICLDAPTADNCTAHVVVDVMEGTRTGYANTHELAVQDLACSPR